jgi:ubiquitin-protein ligase
MRLERDFADMKELRDQSTILQFETSGAPVDEYVVTFLGTTLVPGPALGGPQRVKLDLGSMEYPRSKPQMAWLSPILHPNIWGTPGHMTICLGNFANQWTPYFRLVDMVEILWDMARLAILNPRSAGTSGGDETKKWAELDRRFDFPVDRRPLRNRLLGNDEGSSLLRPEGGPNDIVIMEGDQGACER